MKNYPHDEFFKYLFSILEAAKVFFQTFLPADVLACLDLETLEPDETDYITPELASVFSDKVFRCRLRGKTTDILTAIALLLEHKSYAPAYPHFQLNEYRQRIWAKQLQSGHKPVMVLPVILYHGDEEWKMRSMEKYFTEVPEALKPYLGDFDYVLINLRRFSDRDLLHIRLGFLAYGLLTMKHSSDKTYLVEQFKLIFEQGEEFLKTEQGRNFVEHLFVYYARISEISGENLKRKIVNQSKDMQTTLVSTYEQIKAEGRIEGIKEGIKETSLKVAGKLILKFPTWPDEQIAEICGLSLKEVKTIRDTIEKKKRPSRPSGKKPSGD
mgnify:CR=1 FL=1